MNNFSVENFRKKVLNPWVLRPVAIVLALIGLYTGITGTLITPLIHRAVFLGLALFLFFLKNPTFEKNKNSKLGFAIDVIFALLAFASMAYIFLNNDAIMLHWGDYRTIDVVFSLIIILVVLESVRRAHFAFFILAVCSLLYMYFGPVLPGILRHPGIGIERILTTEALTVEGVYGSPISVCSTYLFLFMMLSAFLEKTGASELFIQLGLSMFGKYTGGPAKVAVVSSSLLGSIVGSPMANVVTTGVFTIPLMKKSGFEPHHAGAVEAVASTGGQIIPPIMGAGAFLMAEITGIPYNNIAIAAIIPSILYVIGVYMAIHFDASKFGLKGVNEGLPPTREVLSKYGHHFISFAVLVYLIMIKGYSALYSAMITLGVVILISFLKKTTRISFMGFLQALEKGANSVLRLAILMGGMGIVVGAIIISGLGMRFSMIILSLSGGNLMITLLLVMLICIVLGMGMPISVAYLISAMFAAPALIDLGVPLLVAHFYVFFFSVSAGLTPPVCLTSIVAAGVAEADWVKTAVKAFVLALPVFIIPFFFIYGNELLMVGDTANIIRSMITSIIGVIALASCTTGWLFRKNTLIERILLGVCAAGLIDTGLVTDIIGIAGIIVICVFQKMAVKKANAVQQ